MRYRLCASSTGSNSINVQLQLYKIHGKKEKTRIQRPSHQFGGLMIKESIAKCQRWLASFFFFCWSCRVQFADRAPICIVKSLNDVDANDEFSFCRIPNSRTLCVVQLVNENLCHFHYYCWWFLQIFPYAYLLVWLKWTLDFPNEHTYISVYMYVKCIRWLILSAELCAHRFHVNGIIHFMEKFFFCSLWFWCDWFRRRSTDVMIPIVLSIEGKWDILYIGNFGLNGSSFHPFPDVFSVNNTCRYTLHMLHISRQRAVGVFFVVVIIIIVVLAVCFQQCSFIPFPFTKQWSGLNFSHGTWIDNERNAFFVSMDFAPIFWKLPSANYSCFRCYALHMRIESIVLHSPSFLYSIFSSIKSTEIILFVVISALWMWDKAHANKIVILCTIKWYSVNTIHGGWHTSLFQSAKNGNTKRFRIHVTLFFCEAYWEPNEYFCQICRKRMLFLVFNKRKR